MIQTRLLHQVISRRPIAMTIKQRSDNSATQHSIECFVVLLRLPLGDHMIALRKAANVQPFGIRWTTTKARVARRVSFLNAFLDVFTLTAMTSVP
jgi:hypothetical protein